MSYRLIRRLSLAAGVLAAAAAPSRACGPFFPSTIVDSGDAGVLWAPVADFRVEIARIAPPEQPPFKASVPEADPYEQTARADLADLAAALSEAEAPPDAGARILADYRQVREALRDRAKAHAEWAADARWNHKDPSPEPRLGAVRLPDGLPGEFADYLRGAVLYGQGRTAHAKAAWTALLDRPAGQRRRRATWAAFMLGKVALEESRPDAAARWFQTVRRLASEGCADSLGLAAASYGWEALAELHRKDHTRAAELYLIQHAAGDPTAVMSLAVTASRLLKAGPDALRQAAGNASARQVVTALIVARGGPRRSCPDEPDADIVRAWLSAVEAAGAKDVAGADRLGWAAYQAGDFDAASRWVERAPPDAPVALWVGAKLLLRSGEADQAAGILARVVRAFPADAVWRDVHYVYVKGDIDWPDDYAPADQAAGELAMIRLSRRQYAESLDLLLGHGRWTDAAYVAERVLTPEELTACVDRHWPASAAKYDEAGDVLRPAGGRHGPGYPSEAAGAIRHLLARRLTRIGRWKEARPYYPPRWQGPLDAYVGAIRAGDDPNRPATDRGRSLWQAAKIARWYGMELLGSELEPDFALHDGRYGDYAVAAGRTENDKWKLLPVSADERSRAGRSEVAPLERFHYRYIAADHAWRAAGLLPDQSEETARVLCQAGTWLKVRDPKAADRFYKALVIRCRRTELGRKADQLRWFPDIELDRPD